MIKLDEKDSTDNKKKQKNALSFHVFFFHYKRKSKWSLFILGGKIFELNIR